jgi:hypothetical protein
MERRIRRLVIVALVVLSALGLTGALLRCGGPETPARATPTATGGTEPAPTTTTPAEATTEPDMPTESPTPTLTPTPTEGEKAAAAVGQQYIAYRPTKAECEKIVDGGEAEACVWLESTQVITRPEWGQLFPDTDFYLLEMGGYRPDSMEVYDSRRRLAAWQDDQHYTAETFDRLLQANGVLTITEEHRELVAKAFALMTIPSYLEEEVVFTEWEEGSWPASFDWYYNYALTAWTKIQGLEIRWWFMFEDGQLRITDGAVIERQVDDYIDIPFMELSPPSRNTFLHYYWRR